MLMLAPWVRPLTRPTNCWSGRIFETGGEADQAGPVPANRLAAATRAAIRAAFLVLKGVSFDLSERNGDPIPTKRKSQKCVVIPTPR
jgi:hypothetical protein